MRPILDDLLGEIQRSIGYYKAQTRNVVIERVVLLGNALKLRGLVEYFRRSLDYEVVVLDKLERIRVGDGSEAEKFFAQLPNYGAAIGLALQGLGLARVNIDMQPAAVVRARAMRQKIPFVAAAVGLLALPIFLGRRSVERDIAYCESQIKAVDPQINALVEKETQEKKEADLGAMPKDLEEMLPIGRGRSRWLHFFDSLNKALESIPRDQYLLRFIGEEQLTGRRAASRRRRMMMMPPEPGAKPSEQEDKTEKEPKELRVELQFQREGKSTTFSDEDVTKLKRLLKAAPHVRDVEIGLRPTMKREVPDPRATKGAEGAATEVEVQHLIVIFSMEPAGEE
jgi:cell division ATPase FtsA